MDPVHYCDKNHLAVLAFHEVVEHLFVLYLLFIPTTKQSSCGCRSWSMAFDGLLVDLTWNRGYGLVCNVLLTEVVQLHDDL